jgi:hypothetical protein
VVVNAEKEENERKRKKSAQKVFDRPDVVRDAWLTLTGEVDYWDGIEIAFDTGESNLKAQGGRNWLPRSLLASPSEFVHIFA